MDLNRQEKESMNLKTGTNSDDTVGRKERGKKKNF